MATDFFRVNPIAKYEFPSGVSKILAATGAFTAGSDRQVVAAVTGKRHRIMGWIAQTAGATAGSVTMKDSTGGTGMVGPFFAPINTLPPWSQPIEDSGYYETTTSGGIFVDIATATVNLTVFYVTYTP